jgi:glutaconyl-CoA decarboxylase
MRKFKIVVNGKAYEVEVEELNGAAVTSAASETAPAPSPAPASAGGESITAPLPGTVWKLKTSQGASVKAGDVLLILEAMKMENEIQSPVDGVVSEVRVKEGAAVETGQVLVVIS